MHFDDEGVIFLIIYLLSLTFCYYEGVFLLTRITFTYFCYYEEAFFLQQLL